MAVSNAPRPRGRAYASLLPGPQGMGPRRAAEPDSPGGLVGGRVTGGAMTDRGALASLLPLGRRRESLLHGPPRGTGLPTVVWPRGAERRGGGAASAVRAAGGCAVGERPASGPGGRPQHGRSGAATPRDHGPRPAGH